MRIVLAPSGPLAEIHAMYGLADELRDRGHSVSFCAPEFYRSQIMKLGYPIVSSGASFLDYLDADTNRSEELVSKLIEELPVQFVSFRDVLREADLVVSTMLQPGAASVAEQRNLPHVSVVFNPVYLERAQFPNIGIPRVTGLFPKLRGRPLMKLWQKALVVLNRERSFSHLKPVPDWFSYLFDSGRLLIAADPALAPFEQRGKQIATGFWFFDRAEQPAAQTAERSKHVYISTLHNRNFERAVATALKAAGFEPVLWPEQDVTELPVSSVLSKSACVIHSGSGPVCGSALRFDVPQVVVPFFENEWYWANKLQTAQIGSIANERSVEAIVNSVLGTVADHKIQERVQAMGQKVRSRNGVREAADAIDAMTP